MMALFPIWMIGCGNMAGAMLTRWLESGLEASSVTVVRPSGRSPAPGVRTVTAVPDDSPPAAVLLGVKPQKLDEVAASIAAAVGPDTVIISILAGVEEATLRTRFPDARAIVRAMPNTPVAIGRGVVGLYSPDADEELRRALEALLQPLGLVEWIANETLFDAVTALARSGPAFLFRFVDALADGGAAIGLSGEQALRLARATVDGAAGLALCSDETPAALADRVASPGGSTRKGLEVLDGRLFPLLRHALEAAVARNKEMAHEARAGR